MPFYIILGLCAFMITLIGTRLMILTQRTRTAPVDVARLMGKKPPAAPGGGGIVIIFTLVIILLAANMNYALILSLLLLAAVSLLHDLIHIPLGVRLLIQAMAVAIPLSFLPNGLFDPLLSPVPDKIITGLLWVWFINAIASLDHSEGLCTTEIVSINTGLCLLAVFGGSFPSELSTFSFITAAAAVGFLWWNWPGAKIRLGDVGATPLGFLTGYLLLLSANAGYSYAIWLLPAYVLADAFLTHAARLYRCNRSLPYYYQKALAKGNSLSGVLRLVIGVNILLTFLATRCLIDKEITLFNIAVGFLCVFMLLGYFAHHKHSHAK